MRHFASNPYAPGLGTEVGSFPALEVSAAWVARAADVGFGIALQGPASIGARHGQGR
jgi:hypothetical protein